MNKNCLFEDSFYFYKLGMKFITGFDFQG